MKLGDVVVVEVGTPGLDRVDASNSPPSSWVPIAPVFVVTYSGFDFPRPIT
jgi:hypothetical protein